MFPLRLCVQIPVMDLRLLFILFIFSNTDLLYIFKQIKTEYHVLSTCTNTLRLVYSLGHAPGQKLSHLQIQKGIITLSEIVSVDVFSADLSSIQMFQLSCYLYVFTAFLNVHQYSGKWKLQHSEKQITCCFLNDQTIQQQHN